MKKKILTFILILLSIAVLVWAADTTYQTKVYVKQGGDEQVIASGGKQTVESGGIVDIESGGFWKLAGTAVTATATEINKLAGIVGDLITTTNTKTMTNKTLTSPTINSPTITSPTITGTTSIGDGATITTPVIASPDISFAVSTKVLENVDWTLSSTEAKSLLLIVSSGSGTLSIIAPTTSGKAYILQNASTNIAVTLKQSGGTGISVASSRTAVLINNGSDYVRVTADAAQ